MISIRSLFRKRGWITPGMEVDRKAPRLGRRSRRCLPAAHELEGRTHRTLAALQPKCQGAWKEPRCLEAPDRLPSWPQNCCYVFRTRCTAFLSLPPAAARSARFCVASTPGETRPAERTVDCLEERPR